MIADIHCVADMADKEETEKTIAEDLVVTKYKMAGEIVNRKETVARVRAGVRAVASERSARAPARLLSAHLGYTGHTGHMGHMECGLVACRCQSRARPCARFVLHSRHCPLATALSPKLHRSPTSIHTRHI